MIPHRNELFGLIMDYDIISDLNSKRRYLNSDSYLKNPNIKYSQDLFSKNNLLENQETQVQDSQIYKHKIMIKNINDYVQMKNMIALITKPDPKTSSDDDKCPQLLILLIPNLKSIMNNFYLYEIPSSLHMIDISKAQFIT